MQEIVTLACEKWAAGDKVTRRQIIQTRLAVDRVKPLQQDGDIAQIQEILDTQMCIQFGILYRYVV